MKTSDDALDALLAESRIAVRPGFRERVMAALPVAVWERRPGERRLPAWALPAALAAAFTAAATLVLTIGGASAADSHALGITAAVFDFFASAALAGAGLLAATWRGLGMALGELIFESGRNLLALATVVLFLDLLFFVLLRRRRSAVRENAGKR